MSPALLAAAVAAALATLVAGEEPCPSWCEAPKRTQAGWVCGVQQRTIKGKEYVSYLGVPYAKQPLGELRFQELQPLEPWEGCVNATEVGPVCPQTDVFYGPLNPARGGMGEACVRANVHVPLTAPGRRGRPVLVFVHGGGFAFGSGDPDLHGPDYLVQSNVVVITFNYRLNLLGFLSLNSSSIPGNNGLRDCVTLLRWVRDNARAFGMNPAQVTIAGHSAGGAIAHLLTLLPAAKGLFRGAIAMSGVATADFYSSSPVYAKTVADLALSKLGLDPALDAEELHRQLVAMPIDAIVAVNKELLDVFGMTTFVPVVESPHPGVTPMLLEDPQELMNRGYGNDIPLILGFTDAECESFVPRFKAIDIPGRLNSTPALLVTPRLTYQASPRSIPRIVKAVREQYLKGGTDALHGFVHFCSDAYYMVPALRVGEQRHAAGAHTWFYKFAYESERSVVKEALGLRFRGAGHMEDLTYMFRAGVLLKEDRPTETDGTTLHWMCDVIFVDFIKSSLSWHEIKRMRYRHVMPYAWRTVEVSSNELVARGFFDDMYELAAA